MSAQAAPPRVTIITATYNYSSVLRCAIQSVLRQTFQDFEYLIIGDGCTDDSAQVVAAFNDPRVRFHNLPGNTGNQSLPNNKGLELARGAYIAYLGHDDLWLPTHLERLVQTMDETRADWATALVLMLGPAESGISVLVGLVEPGTDPRYAACLPSGVMHTRALAQKIGGWREYRTIESTPDIDFHKRAQEAGTVFAHVDNISAIKFSATWRKNVYRERPSHEQTAYLDRMTREPEFLLHELLESYRTQQFKLDQKWFAQMKIPDVTDPTAPRGSRTEHWRRYRGLEPNALTPRPLTELLRLRARRVLADVTRPVRKRLRRSS